MKRCSKCKLQWYCSPACQKIGWQDIHRLECKYMRKMIDIPKDHHAYCIFRTCLKLLKAEEPERDKGIIELEPNYNAIKNVTKEVEATKEWCFQNQAIVDDVIAPSV